MIREEQIEALFKCLALGASVTDSCTMAGVSLEWFYKRRAKNKEFAQRIEKSIIDAKINNLGIIQKAANTSWQAAAWYLERKYKQEYSLKSETEISGPNGQPISMNYKVEFVNATEEDGTDK